MRTQEERIAALEQDMTASFKQLVQYHIQTENQLDKRFDQVDARLHRIESDITDIKATMVTKEDLDTKLEAMESRILNAFQQLVSIISTQHPTTEGGDS